MFTHHASLLWKGGKEKLHLWATQGKRSWNVLTWLPSLLCWLPLVKGHPTASWSLHILSCIVHLSVSNQDPDPLYHRGTFYLSLKSLKAEGLSMRHEGSSGSRVPLGSQPAWIPWDFILGSHENASWGGAGTIQKMCSNLEKKEIIKRIWEGTQGWCPTQKA